ncbi:MAG: hypothetical protein QM813_15170 [Verrucomicrobiota bacterium]
MKYCFHYLLAVLLLVTLTACSKKETPPPAPDPTPAAESPATPAAKPVDLGQWENQVGTALQQQNYNVAVDTLARVNSASPSLSDAQRAQYLQQLQRTMDALAQAAATDAAAKAGVRTVGADGYRTLVESKP